MYKYWVEMVSDDKQKMYVQIGAATKSAAAVYATELIEQRGWEIYGYVVTNIELITTKGNA